MILRVRGHKFNFCFKCCIFADNRIFSLFSPPFSSFSCSSNGIYFRILFKSLWNQLYEFIMPKNTKKCKHLCQYVLLFYAFNVNDQFRPKALKGGTTLNNRPIGLYIRKILNFNGRFEAFSARYRMILFYQPIQNRWKFNMFQCLSSLPTSFCGTGV